MAPCQRCTQCRRAASLNHGVTSASRIVYKYNPCSSKSARGIGSAARLLTAFQHESGAAGFLRDLADCKAVATCWRRYLAGAALLAHKCMPVSTLIPTPSVAGDHLGPSVFIAQPSQALIAPP